LDAAAETDPIHQQQHQSENMIQEYKAQVLFYLFIYLKVPKKRLKRSLKKQKS